MKAEKIEVGLEVKSCKSCSRRDCSECDYLKEFNKLLALPQCIGCLHSHYENRYDFCPIPGEQIRINCAFYEAN